MKFQARAPPPKARAKNNSFLGLKPVDMGDTDSYEETLSGRNLSIAVAIPTPANNCRMTLMIVLIAGITFMIRSVKVTLMNIKSKKFAIYLT
jgi:hypothetical protein